jgi:hypothetical protein
MLERFDNPEIEDTNPEWVTILAPGMLGHVGRGMHGLASTKLAEDRAGEERYPSPPWR